MLRAPYKNYFKNKQLNIMLQNVGKRKHRTENERKKQALMYFNSGHPPKKLFGFEIKYEHVTLFVHLYKLFCHC